MNRLSSVLDEHLWAVEPQVYATMRDTLRAVENGAAIGTLPQREEAYTIEATGGRTAYAKDTRRAHGGQTAKAVLVVPVEGVIFPKGSSELLRVFGGTSLSEVVGVIRRGVNDPSVSSIVAVFDSPGGLVSGVPESAAEIRSLRGVKPMTSVAAFQATSAAYWLASSFDELIASPSSSLGSIGVVSSYISEGAALEAAGIAVQTLKHPSRKAEADGVTPLSEEAMAYRMIQVKRVYDQFVSDLVRGRRIPRAQIEETFGRGRSLDAEQAVRVKMADRLGTLETVLADHVSERAARSGAFRSHINALEQRAIELPRQARTADWLRRRWNLPAAN